MDSSVNNVPSSSNQNFFPLNSLPTVLIIEIFSHLNKKDLESLSLTYKNFSKIINGTEALADKLDSLIFTKNTQFKEIPEQFVFRKFPKVDIYGRGMKKFLEIHDKIAKHIRILSIDYLQLDVSDLLAIFESCVNLKELRLTTNFCVKINDSKFSFNLPVLRLEKLFMCSCLASLEIFKNCDINALILRKCATQTDENVGNFLSSKNALKSLEFRNFHSCSMNLSENVQFCLEKLCLINCSNHFVNQLKGLLETQKESIQNVKIIGITSTAMNLLTELKNLKTLEISFKNRSSFESFPNFSAPKDCDIESFPVLQQIESLTVSGTNPDDEELMTKFPNVKIFNFQHLEIKNFRRGTFAYYVTQKVKSPPLNSTCLRPKKI